MKRFLMFETLIAPWIIRVVAWAATIVVFFGGLRILVTKNFVGGLLLMLVGPFAVRLVAELLHMPFKIHAAVLNLKKDKQEVETVKQA